MSLEFTGVIKKINATQVVSEKFKKREVWVTDNAPHYPQVICFEAIQDQVDILDAVKEGDEVTVGFNLKGREHTNTQGVTKVYNTLQCWKVVKLAGAKFSNETLVPTPDDDLSF